MEEKNSSPDYWKVIVKRKKFIVVLVTAFTFLSVIISLILPKFYQGRATLMVLGGQVGNLAAMAAQLGVGGLLGGMGGGGKSSTTQLLTILRSRTLAEKVIEKYELTQVYFPNKSGKVPPMEDVVATLFSSVSFDEDRRSQTIIITSEMKDPELAATLANGYVKELEKYIQENTLTSSKRNRIFIEEQLERNKVELLNSGKELTSFYSTNKVSNVVPTVDVDVSMTSVEQPQAIEDLRKKIGEVEKNIAEAKIVRDVPQQVYLQYFVLRRELLAQMNTLLSQQYELAKIEEVKEDLNFQVVDWARVPVKKFKPKRKQIVLTCFAMSLFSSIVLVFFMEYWKRLISYRRLHT